MASWCWLLLSLRNIDSLFWREGPGRQVGRGEFGRIFSLIADVASPSLLPPPSLLSPPSLPSPVLCRELSHRSPGPPPSRR